MDVKFSNLDLSINYISFMEGYVYFWFHQMRNPETLANNDKIRQVTKKKSRSRFFTKIFPRSRQPLNTSLVEEEEVIFNIAATPMNDNVRVHRRILLSIYILMTKNPTCPRFGSHWGEIGFQGKDPATDLRGVGMFGALQMLFLASDDSTKDTLAPDILKLSNHPVLWFPLGAVSINATKMALDALRDGILNKFCNQVDSTSDVVNEFYLAILYQVYVTWTKKQITMLDAFQALKAVEKWCRANPKKAIRRLRKYIANHPQNSAKSF